VTPPAEIGPDAISELLGQTPIFSELSDRNLKSLGKEVKVRYLDPGETVVKRGEAGLGFYLILAGEVEVRKGNRSLARLGAGQFFGEMSLFDSQPRSADVVTTRPTAVGVLSRWELDAFAETHRGVYKGMLLELARRLRETNKSLSE
jgi:CRP/FNR family transcriptional regulator, cyclic AMP receptor protein